MVYRSGSSALKSAGWKKGRPDVADLIGMAFAIPRGMSKTAAQVRGVIHSQLLPLPMIAPQIHLALSSTPEWMQVDRCGFDSDAPYWSLVDIISRE